MTQLVVFRARPGPRRRRAVPAVAGGDRQHRPAARPRPLAGPDRRGLRRRVDHRAGGRRLHRRQHELALDLPRQPAGRRRRARRDLADDAAPRAADASTRSTGSAPGCSRPARRRCCSGSSGAAATTPGRAATWSARSRSPRSLLAAFALVERRAREPILPFEHPPQPDRRRQRRVHGARRHGDVRDDLVRAALRAGRDRHVGDLVGRRAHTAHARRGDDVAPHGPARLAHRPLPLERVLGPLVLALGMVLLWRMDVAHDERRGRAQHGRSPASGSAR